MTWLKVGVLILMAPVWIAFALVIGMFLLPVVVTILLVQAMLFPFRDLGPPEGREP